MSAAQAIGAVIVLSIFGSIVATCLVLLVAERQSKRRERRGLK